MTIACWLRAVGEAFPTMAAIRKFASRGRSVKITEMVESNPREASDRQVHREASAETANGQPDIGGLPKLTLRVPFSKSGSPLRWAAGSTLLESLRGNKGLMLNTELMTSIYHVHHRQS